MPGKSSYESNKIRAQVFCGLRNTESCQGNLPKIKCETFRKLPLVAFPHSAAEKFRISADRNTTVRSHCTTDVQPMHTSVRHPVVP